MALAPQAATRLLLQRTAPFVALRHTRWSSFPESANTREPLMAGVLRGPSPLWQGDVPDPLCATPFAERVAKCREAFQNFTEQVFARVDRVDSGGMSKSQDQG